MHNIITRYDIKLNSSNEKVNLDFILNTTDKKIVHGTVWNDDLSNPERVAEALVLLYKQGKKYDEDPLDIQNIGYVVTDNSGEFFAGPFDADSVIIFKVFKMNRKDDDMVENSFQINDA